MGVDARMYVVVKGEWSPKRVRRLAYEVGEAFGANKFFRYTDPNTGKMEWHNISKLKNNTIEQDGPDWVAPEGTTLLEVHLWTRYYGPGYERGDFPFLYILAGWLERRTGGEIMYGGDSSGICAKPFGSVQREKMFDHFVSDHGADYYRHFGVGSDLLVPTCEVCLEPMHQFGWGPGAKSGSFTCHGCGLRLNTKDGGVTFQESKEK